MTGSGSRIWRGVEGLKEKFNDVLLHCGQNESQRLCIFFGGDVQNFEKEMVAHRDHGKYKDYRFVLEAIHIFCLVENNSLQPRERCL